MLAKADAAATREVVFRNSLRVCKKARFLMREKIEGKANFGQSRKIGKEPDRKVKDRDGREGSAFSLFLDLGQALGETVSSGTDSMLSDSRPWGKRFSLLSASFSELSLFVERSLHRTLQATFS